MSAAEFVTRVEFNTVLDRLQDLEDADYMRAVEADASQRDYLPLAALKRLIAGESPIRIWRESRGLSVSALAEAAGVSRSYLSEIEDGKKPGSIVAYRAVAAALSVSIDDLLPDEDAQAA